MKVSGHAVSIKIGANLKGVTKGFRDLKSKVTGLGSSLAIPFHVGRIAVDSFTKALSTAVKLMTTDAIRAAAKFEYAFAEVKTIIDKTRWDLGKASEELHVMARTIGMSVTDVTKALYQTVSAGVTSQAEAMNVVKVATKASIGGLTDAATSVDAVTSILNAYGLSAWDAERVSDQLLKTVALGKTHYEELGSSIGRVIPIAARFGVSSEEVLAGIAELTLGGLSTAEAVTALRAVLTGIAKPTEQASAKAKELALDFSVSALQAKGLANWLLELNDAIGDDADAMTDLFGNVRGLIGVLSLGGEGAWDFADAVHDIAQSMGETDRMAEEMNNTVEGAWKRFKESFSQLLEDLGNQYLPGVHTFLDSLAKTLSKGLKDAFKGLTGESEDYAKTGEELGTKVGEFILTVHSKIKGFITSMLDTIVENKDTLLGILTNLTEGAAEMGDALTEHGPKAASALIKIAGAISKLATAIDTLVAPIAAMRDAADWTGDQVLQFLSWIGLESAEAEYIRRNTPAEEDWMPKDKFQHGGWIGGRGGTDQNLILATAGEYVVNKDTMASPLGAVIEAWNELGGKGASYTTDNSANTITINLTTPVDRQTIREQVIPEIQRAYEVGGFRRERTSR